MRGIKRFLQAINLCSSKILGFDPTAEPAGGRGPMYLGESLLQKTSLNIYRDLCRWSFNQDQ